MHRCCSRVEAREFSAFLELRLDCAWGCFTEHYNCWSPDLDSRYLFVLARGAKVTAKDGKFVFPLCVANSFDERLVQQEMKTFHRNCLLVIC